MVGSSRRVVSSDVLRLFFEELRETFPLKKIREIELEIKQGKWDGAYIKPLSTRPLSPLEFKIVLPNDELDSLGMLVHEYFHILLADKHDLCFVLALSCNDRVKKKLFTDPTFINIVRSSGDVVVDFNALRLLPAYDLYLREVIEENVETLRRHLNIKNRLYSNNIKEIIPEIVYMILISKSLRDHLDPRRGSILNNLMSVIDRSYELNGIIRKIISVLSGKKIREYALKDPVHAYETLLNVLTYHLLDLEIAFSTSNVLDPKERENITVKCIDFV